MRILGIETSCDETAASVVEGRCVLSNVVSSQAKLHGRYYGVVPELASRAHQQKIAGVIAAAVSGAFPGARLKDIPDCVDAVAFTQGPGLAGALLVGKVAAQTLASMHRLPLVGVNHLEGHAFAVEFEKTIRFPFIALIVSGGHTDLVLVKGYGRYRVLGRTRDDAAGEAFDKIAKLLNLGYPGGPIIDRLAAKGDPGAVNFPRPLLPGCWDFSFSGLKTAVLYHVQHFSLSPVRGRGKGEGVTDLIRDLCASFQEAVVETLVEKAIGAARHYRVRSIVVGGGVAANRRLRELFAQRAAKANIEVHFPAPALCTDNGAMIARVAALRIGARRVPKRFSIHPSMPMRNW